MKGTTRQGAGASASRGRVGAGWALAALGLCASAMAIAPGPALAVPIRHQPFAWREVSHAPPGRLGHADALTFQKWARYLVTGPRVWDRVIHPPWTAPVRRAAFSALRRNPSVADPMVRFLAWKRSLDPARFDHYHPRLARRMRRIVQALPPPTQTLTPPPVPPPTVPQEESLTPPPAVPEPSMSLLALGMTAWLVWRRRRAETNAREPKAA